MTEPPSKRSKTGGIESGDAGPSSNPYLAHLNPSKAATGSNGTGNGNGVAPGTGKNPLNGLVPRMVTTEQAKKILVSHLAQWPTIGLTSRTAMSTPSKTWYRSRQITKRF